VALSCGGPWATAQFSTPLKFGPGWCVSNDDIDETDGADVTQSATEATSTNSCSIV